MELPSAFLALPTAGDLAFARLERKVRLLALRALLTHRGGLSPPQAAALPALQSVIADCARRHRPALLAAVAQPDVLAPLLVLHAGLRPAGPLLQTAVPALLLALVQMGALTESVVWPGPLTRVVDAGGGRLFTQDPPAQGLLASPDGAELRLVGGQLVPIVGPGSADCTGIAALHEVRPGLHLSLFDTNPLADIEAHPDKQGNAVSLGDRPADEWVASLRGALDIVADTLPAWFTEIRISLRRIVPVGYQPERHLSASYREAPGICYATLHPDPLTMAEALVHETQHGKMGILLHLDPVLHNGRTTWTPSPVRPDLRPLMGLLLAVHAFVPVAAMHARLAEADHPLSRTARFAVRRREVLAGNAAGLQTVKELGQPSAMGARLVRDLVGLHTALANLVPDLAVAPGAMPPG